MTAGAAEVEAETADDLSTSASSDISAITVAQGMPSSCAATGAVATSRDRRDIYHSITAARRV